MEFNLNQTLEILERTPGVLDALLRGLSEGWIQNNEGDGTWSPFDVLGHLIHAEETDWMVRSRIILSRSADRRFPPFDRLGHQSEIQGKTVAQLLDRFAEARSRNLAELEGLGLRPEQLRLTGEHPEFGTVTFEQLLATWVVHDLGHLAQATRVMARQYRDAVGPWQAYLPVLTR